MTIILQSTFDPEYFDALKKEASKMPDIDPNTKICFIDVDGVLNNEAWIDAHIDKPIDELINPAAVAILNTLIEKTGVKLVISSSWRIDFLNQPFGFKKMQDFFAKFNITNIVGMTPHFRGRQRHEEIADWLAKHKVKSFVILDDDLGANVDNKQVQTLATTGLLEHHIDEAIKILNNE